jgi:hypothetical protein
MWLAQQSHDGFACVRSCGTPYGDLFDVTVAIHRPRSSAEHLTWQDRSIIQVQIPETPAIDTTLKSSQQTENFWDNVRGTAF